MSKILVQKTTPKQLSSGKTIYKCIGTIDGEVDQFDMWLAPKIDEEFEGTIKESQYGKSVFVGNSGASGKGSSGPRNELTQRQIMRQNGLTNATNRGIALFEQHARFASTEAELDAIAEQFLSGKKLAQVTLFFARVSEEGVPEEIKAPSVQEQPPLPEYQGEEISLDELQF